MAPILEKYIRNYPSPQNALDLFKGGWQSKLPDRVGTVQTGKTALFDDPRVEWALDKSGGAKGKTILEFGPLEAAHTNFLEKMGRLGPWRSKPTRERIQNVLS